jgi:hypothetical protein
MRRLRFAVVVAALLALPVAYVSLIAISAWRSGLTLREMDLDRDGSTTFSEVWFVADHGVRPVTVAGHQCSEIFLLKDGLPVKTICPPG